MKGATSAHFSHPELACRHCGVNACRPELVDALEQLRTLAGVPIHVDDAYRCQAHNASIPGAAPDSEHVNGTAADIKIGELSAWEMYRLALQVPAFAQGGIGVAEHQSYIHVDVRPHHARWCYDLAGRAAPWRPDRNA